MQKLCGYVILMMCACSAVAFSQIKPGSFEIGGFSGYHFLDDFVGERPKDHLLYGVRFAVFMTEKVSFEPSYQLTLTQTNRVAGGNVDANFHHVRFNLLYHFLSQGRVFPFMTGGLGWLRSDISDLKAANDLDVNTGLGVKVFVRDNLLLRADVRYVYAEVSDQRQHNYEGSLGLSYLFGGMAVTDTDGDGVKDNKDKCPQTPAGAKVDLEGCPTDSDGDGVFDGIDACPETPQGVTVDGKGCPTDTDGDGVFDGIDACPDTPVGMPVDARGCPMDADGDGVANEQDLCPNTPQGVAVDDKGCPVDSDGDGVPDFQDQCANTPTGTVVDLRGCPEKTLSRGVLLGVNFKSGSAELAIDSYKILDAVVKDLLQFPQVKVEVQGHTDSTGAAETNLRISNQRAGTVVEYLVSKGVPRERLEARGYGTEQPIADNATAQGRAKNRRVELKWLD